MYRGRGLHTCKLKQAHSQTRKNFYTTNTLTHAYTHTYTHIICMLETHIYDTLTPLHTIVCAQVPWS